ncbi:MAG: diguanylate cyclase [Clostridiales Family XIII bacterium]|nr:diguanylate cyclase [Clostridiales Family XIII bacterium]
MNIESLPEDFHDLGEGLLFFGNALAEVRSFASDLARGELNGKTPGPDNELATGLKSLHATLKHLTWQTKQVANGNYEQHIDFMGEFADAFNLMIDQLRERKAEHEQELAEIQKSTKELERSNSLFETITSQMTEWIVMIDKETGEHLFANHPIEKALTNDIFEAQLYAILLDYAKEMEEDANFLEEEFPLISDTEIQWFSVILYSVKWYGHNAVAAVLHDITHEKEQQQELENVAYKDMLTGTYNRHYGMKLLNGWIDQHKACIICFIDMDRLKYVNDVFGHAEGDKYILTVSELLKQFSSDAVVCRLGGDEYMLLAANKTLEEAEAILERLRDNLASDEYTDESGAITYKRSFSYGVIEVPETNTISSSDLLSQADEKMYEYKKAHKAERRDAPG